MKGNLRPMLYLGSIRKRDPFRTEPLSSWARKAIVSDSNEMARQCYEVQFAFPIDFHNEINRDPLADLLLDVNYGDHNASQGSYWAHYAK
tara:strand:- start:46 stop:315 length:270 start_codon:yes stop_codon:yes gene_type:complete